MALKELKEQAVKYLAFLPAPVDSTGEGEVSLTLAAQVAALRATRTGPDSDRKLTYEEFTALRNSQTVGRDAIPKPDFAIEIGRALKRVDRSLFMNWATWCAPCFTTNIAIIMWDAFEPIACDVHSADYSQVRNSSYLYQLLA